MSAPFWVAVFPIQPYLGTGFSICSILRGFLSLACIAFSAAWASLGRKTAPATPETDLYSWGRAAQTPVFPAFSIWPTSWPHPGNSDNYPPKSRSVRLGSRGGENRNLRLRAGSPPRGDPPVQYREQPVAPGGRAVWVRPASGSGLAGAAAVGAPGAVTGAEPVFGAVPVGEIIQDRQQKNQCGRNCQATHYLSCS